MTSEFKNTLRIMQTPGGVLTHHEDNAVREELVADLKLGNIFKMLRRAGQDPEDVFRSGAQILEIGAGVGPNQRMLRAVFPGLKYTEVEIDHHVSAASQVCNPEGQRVVANIMAHIDSVPDGSLDVVLGFNSLDQYSEAQLEVLGRKIFRKLKSGGVFMHSIDQNQAPKPMRTYLERHRKTPDGRATGHPLVILAPVGTSGFTTGLIFMGPKEDRNRALNIFDAQWKTVFETGSRSRRESPFSGNERLVPETEYANLRKQFAHAGLRLTTVDHNQLLNDILHSITAKYFGTENAWEHAYETHATVRGPRKVRGGIGLVGLFNDDDYLKYHQRFGPLVLKASEQWLPGAKSIYVFAYKAKYVIGVKA